MPSGWRKSAVTANQSARPPTIAASIVARTYPSHAQRGSSARVTTNSTVAATSSMVARRFISDYENALKVFNEPNAGDWFSSKLTLRGKSINEVVQFMFDKGLEFDRLVPVDHSHKSLKFATHA